MLCTIMVCLSHTPHGAMQKKKITICFFLSFTLSVSPSLEIGMFWSLQCIGLAPVSLFEKLQIRCSYQSVEAEFISNASLVVVRRRTNKRLAGEAYLSGCTQEQTQCRNTQSIEKGKYVYTHPCEHACKHR